MIDKIGHAAISGASMMHSTEANTVVQDRRFFSCVANMVLLPTPLKAFTDTMLKVKSMPRICAKNLYGWHCEHQSTDEAAAAIGVWEDWSAYPVSWPRSTGERLPAGVMPLNAAIRSDAAKRLARVRRDLEHAGEHYPRDDVRAALAFWHIAI